MHGDEQIAESRIEFAAERCRVRLEAQHWRHGDLGACAVIEIWDRYLDELLTDLEDTI
ncbi:hypothetical protein ANO14919_137810 [Xylariales sp. No.14919]|nr:hypothetical protein ANO14919_137810 [Xylariales sp. No.14919]